jgi:hypothetical protein
MRDALHSIQLRDSSAPIDVLERARERLSKLLVGEKLTATKELGP